MPLMSDCETFLSYSWIYNKIKDKKYKKCKNNKDTIMAFYTNYIDWKIWF